MMIWFPVSLAVSFGERWGETSFARSFSGAATAHIPTTPSLKPPPGGVLGTPRQWAAVALFPGLLSRGETRTGKGQASRAELCPRRHRQRPIMRRPAAVPRSR